MTSSKRRVALLSAFSLVALVGSLALTAAPASAAGSILCSGDLCLQTQSIAGVPSCTAVVREWPYKVNLYGHFEIAEPFNNHYTQNSAGGNKWWRAGIDGYNFTIPYFSNELDTYVGVAWQYSGGSYSNVGQVSFGINGPAGC